MSSWVQRSDSSLRGKRALVLGVSGGIGSVTAEVLAAAGAHITAVGRRADRLQEVCARIGAAGGACDVRAGDLTDSDFAAQLADTVSQSDILVSAVGIAIPEPLLDSDPVNWEQMFRINVVAVMRVTVAAARAMRSRGGGQIVHIGSGLARAVMPNAVGYAASKHALAAFTRGLRLELAGSGVRVIEVSPGLVGDTEFHRHATHPALQGAFSQRPYAPISPVDVARCVCFALELPPGTEIFSLEVRPSGQFYPA